MTKTPRARPRANQQNRLPGIIRAKEFSIARGGTKARGAWDHRGGPIRRIGRLPRLRIGYSPTTYLATITNAMMRVIEPSFHRLKEVQR